MYKHDIKQKIVPIILSIVILLLVLLKKFNLFTAPKFYYHWTEVREKCLSDCCQHPTTSTLAYYHRFIIAFCMFYHWSNKSMFFSDACLRCQGESKKDSYGKQDCVVVWGECNHSFHFCCMSLWVKQNNRCPLCQQEWSIQRMGK